MANREILVVEDEPVLRRIIADTLTRSGYGVTIACDGVEGLECFNANTPDLVIADIMMPRMDGFEMVREMRRRGTRCQCLFLSARSGADDVVEGFHAGGNDYLRKPFAMTELLVRIEALLSRLPNDTSKYSIGSYTFDSKLWLLRHDTKEHKLSAREAAILHILAENIDNVVSSRTILLEIWGDDSYYNLRSLNVFISKLRTLLAEDPTIEINAVRGVGYRLSINK